MTALITPNVRKSTKIDTDLKQSKGYIKDHRMVKGIFRYLQCREGTTSFSFKKYKGDPIAPYKMIDGHTYEVPFMVAKHLNKNCCYEKHSHILDANGEASIYTGNVVQRFSFESLEFQDNED